MVPHPLLAISLIGINSYTEYDSPLRLSYSLDRNFCIFLVGNLSELLSPLDQQDAPRFGTQIIDAKCHQLSLRLDPIQVNVEQRDRWSTILMH